MKKFVYRFESIFKLKKKEEEQAKTNYGNLMAVLISEQEKLAVLEGRSDEYIFTKKELMSKKLQILKIKECEEAIKQMKLFIKEQKLIIKQAEHRVEIARAELNEKMMERKTYEKLKEKDFEKYMLEYQKEEQKEIDQLVSYTYSTK